MLQRRSIPFVCEDVPGTGGVIKSECADFVVEEIPKYEPSGDGDHMYLWIEKRDLSSLQMVRVVARELRVRQSDIGVAGMKDRRAITRQWISVPWKSGREVPQSIGDQIDVLSHGLHGNKLKTGHLTGNRFQIRIRGVGPDAVDSAEKVTTFFNANGIPNFYGDQRFGRDDQTLQLGLALLRGEQETRDRRLKRLALSSVQSHIFNETLIERHRRGALFGAVPGDLLAKVTDDGPRVVATAQLDAANERIRIGAAVPTGPMWGPKMSIPESDCGELERRVLSDVGIEPDSFALYKKLTRGARRTTLVRPLEPFRFRRIEEDIEILFSLPAGSYATVPLWELIKA